MLNGAIDSGIFVWRDCLSGASHLDTAVAGGAATYVGTLTSTSSLLSVVPVEHDPGDVVSYAPDTHQISFTLHTSGPADQRREQRWGHLPAPGRGRKLGPYGIPKGHGFTLEIQTL